jgi:hypothetical protein
VNACEPDRVVVAYTPEYMDEGVTAASQLRSFVEDRTGLPVTMASDAELGMGSDVAGFWRSLPDCRAPIVGVSDRHIGDGSHHPAQSRAECDPDPWRAGVNSA